ncbi:MAG: cytochrome C oxidase subunit IV family protein [Bacteroidota bacterium]
MQGLTSDHIVPLRVYFGIATALFVLLAVTVGVALVDLGPYNIVVALAVAVVKAILVVLFFMHVKYGSRLVWLFAAGGVFWLAILFMFTLSDFLTR